MRTIFLQILVVGLFTSTGMAAAKKQVGVVSLDVCAKGNRIDLLIAQASADAPTKLQYLRSEDGGKTFLAPVSLGKDQPPPEPVHRGMDAQIASSGDNLVAVWTTEANTRFRRGPLACAISSDGGKSWTPGGDPSDDKQISDHAFVDLAADARGVFHCVWLDGRSGLGKGLRYARSTDGGATWSKNQTLIPATCECCWNKIEIGPDGAIYILYRAKDPRDMALIRSDDGGLTWTSPVTVGAFDWQIDGCPHVGGGLAISSIDGKRVVHSVFWTANGKPDKGAFVLSSNSAGATWSKPMQLGTPQSWHPDIACLGNEVVAVWDVFEETDTVSYFIRSTDGGKNWAKPARLGNSAAGYPRIIAMEAGFRVFWTAKGESGKVEWKSQWIPRDQAASR